YTSLPFVLIVWLMPQVVSLALSAARVPLAAHWPSDGERWAIEQMVVVQTIAAAMLAPVLFPSVPATIAVVVSAGPMALLAGFLSSIPLARINVLCQLGGSW